MIFLLQSPDLRSLDNFHTLLEDARAWEPIELNEKRSLKLYNAIKIINGKITRTNYNRFILL